MATHSTWYNPQTDEIRYYMEKEYQKKMQHEKFMMQREMEAKLRAVEAAYTPIQVPPSPPKETPNTLLLIGD